MVKRASKVVTKPVRTLVDRSRKDSVSQNTATTTDGMMSEEEGEGQVEMKEMSTKEMARSAARMWEGNGDVEDDEIVEGDLRIGDDTDKIDLEYDDDNVASGMSGTGRGKLSGSGSMPGETNIVSIRETPIRNDGESGRGSGSRFGISNDADDEANKTMYARSRGVQLYWLFIRGWQQTANFPAMFIIMSIYSLYMAIFYGTLFFQLGYEQGDITLRQVSPKIML